VSYARTAEPIDLPFALWTQVGWRKHKFNHIHRVMPMCPQYHWTVHVQWRYGLLSDYFDHLFLLKFTHFRKCTSALPRSVKTLIAVDLAQPHHNKVTLHWTQFVMRHVTVLYVNSHFGHSASYSQQDGKYVPAKVKWQCSLAGRITVVCRRTGDMTQTNRAYWPTTGRWTPGLHFSVGYESLYFWFTAKWPLFS